MVAMAAVARAAGEANLRNGAVALAQRLHNLDSITLRREEIEALAAPLIAQIPVEPSAARKSAA